MCAFKDDHHIDDRDEEPTEMTAMTGESGAHAPDVYSFGGADVVDEEELTSWDHFTAFVREFAKTPRGICITAAVATAVIIFLAYLMAKVGVGAFHIGSCPLEPFVPIYLVSSGSLLLGFLLVLLLVCLRCNHRGNGDADDRVSPLHLLVLFYFFIHIVLQLAGSVCVIRARGDLNAQLRSEASSAMTEPSVSLVQHTVHLVAPEVTPAYPLMEPVQRVAPVRASSSQHASLPECSSTLLEFAFGTVIFELLVSGLFFILVVASLCELTYIVCYEPTPDSEKKKFKGGNHGNRIVMA